jgi:hypothetical protein
MYRKWLSIITGEKDKRYMKKSPTRRRCCAFYTPTYLLPLTGGGDEIQWLECRCTMCDSHPSLVTFGSVKSRVEAQRLRVVGSVSRARHEDSTKVERCRRDVWSAVGREVGVDADRGVSDSVTPRSANE